MPAGEYSFTIEQGATLQKTFAWRDDNDDPVPLTGYTARMQGRYNVTDPDPPIFEWTTENGNLTINAGQGEILLLVGAAETSAMDLDPQAGFSAGSCVYDLELESNTGVVTRLLKGRISLDPEVTRSVRS